MNEDSLDIALQTSQSLDDSLAGFSQSLIQAANVVGQQADKQSCSPKEKRTHAMVTTVPEVCSVSIFGGMANCCSLDCATKVLDY